MTDPLLKHRCGSFGTCRQRIWRYHRCKYHVHAEEAPGFRHDTYYHGKIIQGLLQPTWGYFTPYQLSMMFEPHRSGDGRPLDEYTV